jgi:hypothetical protein
MNEFVASGPTYQRRTAGRARSARLAFEHVGIEVILGPTACAFEGDQVRATDDADFDAIPRRNDAISISRPEVTSGYAFDDVDPHRR